MKEGYVSLTVTYLRDMQAKYMWLMSNDISERPPRALGSVTFDRDGGNKTTNYLIILPVLGSLGVGKIFRGRGETEARLGDYLSQSLFLSFSRCTRPSNALVSS
eukprot:1027918-Amorphochlora_amoeboformis.AAC.1